MISIGAVGHFAGRLGVGYRILFAVAGIGVLLPANAVPYGLWTNRIATGKQREAVLGNDQVQVARLIAPGAGDENRPAACPAMPL